MTVLILIDEERVEHFWTYILFASFGSESRRLSGKKKKKKKKTLLKKFLVKVFYCLKGNYINFYSTNLLSSLFSIFEKYELEYSVTY